MQQLNVVWYVLFVVIIAGYVVLDGFDMGVGILHLLVAKTDDERRISLNSIGPIWDGNEVWLVTGGGALFAAFPMVYASLFSGFYTALMLVLLVLILRTVAIEFRSKRPGSGWRMTWDFVFWLSSLLMAVLFGVAFGNIIGGVALDRQGNITSGLLALLNPFALIIGVTTVFMLAMHGGVYLTMKTEGALQGRVRRLVPPLMLIFFILNTLVVAATFFLQIHIKDQYLAHPALAIFPALALAALVAAWVLLRRGYDFRAFVCSGLMIMFLILSVAAGLFPNLLVSNINRAYNLTAFNAASEPNTLAVMLVIAIIGMPFVLLYSSAVNYIFRGKVVLGPRSY
jgi:cytochrome bd ubiquinol oxidase subunit II